MNNQRVIKFRVWDESRQEYLVSDFPGPNISESETGGYKLVFGLSGYPWKGPYVIEQFTDLQTHNGRDVYEGDILNTKAARWQVIFENGAFVGKVVASNVFDLGYALPLSAIIEHAIPMGNICENPELVKAE